MTPRLCYLRSRNDLPELCIQKELGDELEVFTLSDGQCDELMIRLLYYALRTRKKHDR
jgi:hypothetical protein